MEKNVLIVYRTNDLFEKWMSIIIRTLEENGFSIETKIFSRETSEKEIENWFGSIETRHLFDKSFITDGTCYNPLNNLVLNLKLGWEKTENILDNIVVLDAIFYSSTTKIVLGETSDEYYKKGERADINRIFDVLLEKMPSPQKAHIFSERLSDHPPYNSIRYKATKGMDKESEELARFKFDREAAIEIRNIFMSKGIDSQLADDTYCLSELDKIGNWIVMDRHLWGRLERRGCSLKNATLLRMPISDFVQDSLDLGFQIPDEIYEEKLIEALKRVI